jgi:hypothetical protein
LKISEITPAEQQLNTLSPQFQGIDDARLEMKEAAN